TALRRSRRSPRAAAPAGRSTSRDRPPTPRMPRARPAARDRAAGRASARAVLSLPRARTRQIALSTTSTPRTWNAHRLIAVSMPRGVRTNCLGEPNPAGGGPGRRTEARRTRANRTASVGDRHVTVVDQLIDRLLDVDVRLDHAALLQREACFQDRFPLVRPDAIEGEPGALLELLVHHRIVESGHADKHLL